MRLLLYARHNVEHFSDIIGFNVPKIPFHRKETGSQKVSHSSSCFPWVLPRFTVKLLEDNDVVLYQVYVFLYQSVNHYS